MVYLRTTKKNNDKEDEETLNKNKLIYCRMLGEAMP